MGEQDAWLRKNPGDLIIQKHYRKKEIRKNSNEEKVQPCMLSDMIDLSCLCIGFHIFLPSIYDTLYRLMMR